MRLKSPAIWLACLLFASQLHAVEPGFALLLDKDHKNDWKQCGLGGLTINNDEATTWFPNGKGYFGVAWYSGRTFADFILRAEWRPHQTGLYNSGIRLRFPNPGNEPGSVSKNGYEISILSVKAPENSKDPAMITGSIAHEQRASAQVLDRPNRDWNDLEVTVIGQKYTVKLNGVVVNEFLGSKGLEGYVGIENHRLGPVDFRNVRIKELSSNSPAAPAMPRQPPALAQSGSDLPRITVLKNEGPNALEWALSPLDEAIPQDIRQNLTFLREDLLDEGKKKDSAGASAEAYRLGSEYCDRILSVLDQRDLARVKAGYAAAQAEADKRVSNAQLDVRRNYQMSWPQYRREESQRAALRQQESSAADLKKERSKVEWMNRAVKFRDALDGLYRQFRETLRQ